MWNVVNPDDIVARYGADTLRLYEMFLGPLEMSKPWDTNGIDGVHRFLRKLWNQYEQISDNEPTAEELRSLHKLIKKVTWDIEHFSFNTSIPAFMIAQSELQKCSKRAILEPIAILLAPFAPHLAEEMYHRCQPASCATIFDAAWPELCERYLEEAMVKYPVQFNGKVRFTMEFTKDATREAIEQAVLAAPQSVPFLNDQTPKKVIVVLGRIVNIVV